MLRYFVTVNVNALHADGYKNMKYTYFLCKIQYFNGVLWSTYILGSRMKRYESSVERDEMVVDRVPAPERIKHAERVKTNQVWMRVVSAVCVCV